MIRNKVFGELAVIFGFVTLWSGGMVLFGPYTARLAAGQVAPFVL